MLDEVLSEYTRRSLFRLSRVSSDDDEFLVELNLDPDGRVELLELLAGRIPENPIEEFLNGPFRRLRKLRHRTRYSDGSYPVFYSALEAATAEAEIAFWFRRGFVGTPKSSRTAYYQGFRCTFYGVEKDLRSKVREWPDLVHDSDYSFCNELGSEARAAGLDGLVVPSARHEGANMPVFVRTALSDPKSDDVVAITYRVDRNDVVISRLPQR